MLSCTILSFTGRRRRLQRRRLPSSPILLLRVLQANHQTPDYSPRGEVLTLRQRERTLALRAIPCYLFHLKPLAPIPTGTVSTTNPLEAANDRNFAKQC